MAGVRIVVIAVFVSSAVVLLPNLLWHTIAFSNKSAQLGGVVKSYSYKIEKHWGWQDFRLVLYGDSLPIKLEPSDVEFEKVLEERWFCNDRMIYLVVQWKHTSSGVSSTDTTRVLYDFERGELYTLAPDRSWQVWLPDRKHGHYLTEPEFDATLLRLETGCKSAN